MSKLIAFVFAVALIQNLASVECSAANERKNAPSSASAADCNKPEEIEEGCKIIRKQPAKSAGNTSKTVGQTKLVAKKTSAKKKV